MKPLFGRASAESSDVPAVTAPDPIVESVKPETPLPGQETDIAQRLQSAMERQALKLLEKEDLSGKELKEALDLSERLLKQRKTIQDAARAEDGAGIEALQEIMDPAKAVERLHRDPLFRAALVQKGWLPPEDRRPGKPSAETSKLRADRTERQRRLNGDPAPEKDDSGLRAMIGD